jgi:predicted PurR-regulated permease PerM
MRILFIVQDEFRHHTIDDGENVCVLLKKSKCIIRQNCPSRYFMFFPIIPPTDTCLIRSGMNIPGIWIEICRHCQDLNIELHTMIDSSDSTSFPTDREPAPLPWLPRERVQILVLVAATLVTLYLCYLLVQPFLAPLAWALALSIIATPMHRWLAQRIPNKGIAATLAVAIVAIIVVGPAFFLGRQLVVEAAEGVAIAQEQMRSGQWLHSIESIPWLATLYHWLEEHVDLSSMIQSTAGSMSTFVSSLVTGSVLFFVELLITFFCLFYFFRDSDRSMQTVASLLPLSRGESHELFQRISDTIHATVYGTLVVCAVQGALAGLMFWWLGIPGPVLWGVIMGLLNIVPVLGPYVIWLPVAIGLAMQGEWGRALILTGWGAVIVGLIDNVLYPVLVGDRMRLHTLPVFFAILGGLVVFGSSGVILGPVVLAITDALIHIWKQRTTGGRSAEEKSSDLIIAADSSAVTE